ncbi:MAG TPA: proteasome accessory factor PafA2 family protein [Candidatus Saccharimonadia bacterium]|nr:proteasome accessory factor PafA2 family protein [Candidatus Saccharimonadia bacterium]
MGEENEYGFVALVNGEPNADRTTEYIAKIRPVSWLYAGARFWCENGCCYYQDINEHPECTTPECLTGKQVAGYSRWSEYALADLVGAALVGAPKSHKLLLVKNNVSVASNKTYGCNENYLTQRQLSFDDVIAPKLMAFLVTRILWAGAGNVVATRSGGWRLEVSQRARHLQADVSFGTTTATARAIVNTRDEPLADKELYRRLHLICGDVNVLWTPSWLKYDIMALMLLMLENNELRHVPKLADPVSSLHRLSRDWNTSLQLDDGSTTNAVAIQRFYLKCAWDFAAKHGLTDQKEALSLLGEILDNFASKDLDANIGQVDWVTKGLQRLKSKTGQRLTLKQAQAKDLDYHVVCGGKGSMQVVRELYDPPETAEWVARCATAAPNNRAAARTRFVKAARSSKRNVTVNWERLAVQKPALKGEDNGWWFVEVKDPFQNKNRAVDELIKRL